MKKKYLALLTALMLTAGISTGAQAAELKALNTQQANIVTVSAFMAKGDLPNLKKSLATALDNGMTVNQAKEVLVHLYAYTGFPRSLNALSTLNNLVQERKAAGINDEMGPDATPLDPSVDRFAKGTEIQTAISGRVVTNEFAPIINTFLREHLFLNPQLTSHFRAAMNTGLTPEQLQEAVDVLDEIVSTDTGSNAQAVLNNVLK